MTKWCSVNLMHVIIKKTGDLTPTQCQFQKMSTKLGHLVKYTCDLILHVPIKTIHFEIILVWSSKICDTFLKSRDWVCKHILCAHVGNVLPWAVCTAKEQLMRVIEKVHAKWLPRVSVRVGQIGNWKRKRDSRTTDGCLNRKGPEIRVQCERTGCRSLSRHCFQHQSASEVLEKDLDFSHGLHHVMGAGFGFWNDPRKLLAKTNNS